MRKRTTRALGVKTWIVAALCLLGVAAAQSKPDSAVIVIDSPAAGEPIFGDVVFEVRVVTGEVDEVVFLVDAEEAGRARTRPYRVNLSLGDDLGAHTFEAVAYRGGNVVARVTRTSPGLSIDDSIDLALRQIYVTINGEREGEPLSAGDFEVRDDGRVQEIVTFEGGDAALALALLIDASESMRGGRLVAAIEGARALLGGLKQLDEAAVFLFADSLVMRTPFTQDHGALLPTLRALMAEGGTALNDTLFLALRQLEGRQGRRVVVLLSDGVDIHSTLGIEEVLWTMRRSRSIVYWIALEESEIGRLISPWRTSEAHAAERAGLRLLVEESGGRVLPIASTGEAEAAFAEILAELRSQFVLGYYPSIRTGDGKWRKIAVRLDRRGLKARTRGGYLDY